LRACEAGGSGRICKSVGQRAATVVFNGARRGQAGRLQCGGCGGQRITLRRRPQRVTGRQDKGGRLNTNSDQQAALCLDAGMRCISRAGVQARGALHRGGKEHCSTAHQRSNGLPTMGNVWLGLRRPFCASLGAHCTDAVLLQKCLTLASMGRTEERSCLCACRACNTCLAVHMAGDAAQCSPNGGRCEGPGIASQRTLEPNKATTSLLVAGRIPASGLE
jgi:hypothetical protein